MQNTRAVLFAPAGALKWVNIKKYDWQSHCNKQQPRALEADTETKEKKERVAAAAVRLSTGKLLGRGKKRRLWQREVVMGNLLLPTQQGFYVQLRRSLCFFQQKIYFLAFFDRWREKSVSGLKFIGIKRLTTNGAPQGTVLGPLNLYEWYTC